MSAQAAVDVARHRGAAAAGGGERDGARRRVLHLVPQQRPDLSHTSDASLVLFHV